MKLWEWIELGLPTHPMLYSSGRIISFILGKKLALCKKLNLELSTSQIACTNRFIIFMMWLASTFNVLTYRAATSYVAGISTTSKSFVVGLRSTLNLPLALWDSTPVWLFPLRLMRYISVLHYLYMWLHFYIYIDVLCVPAYRSRDGTDTQRLDRLRSGRYNWYPSSWWGFHLLSSPRVVTIIGSLYTY